MMRLLGTCALALVVAGCGDTGGAGVPPHKTHIVVVAAENFWGSIAESVGGDQVTVISLVRKPAADPHDYEPTAQDSRDVAVADYVIVTGAGYDSWAQKLIDANPQDGRRELDVGALSGRKAGDNPHTWYDPAIVLAVIDRLATDFATIDPSDAAAFKDHAATFRGRGLDRYSRLRAAIKGSYGGVAVGATESIFTDMAADLGLNLVTPPGYMNAIAEGEDPTPGDVATVIRQIDSHQIKVLVYNTQNATPDVQRLVARARSAQIPVVPITETPGSADEEFATWQADQLDTLRVALGEATGR